MRVKRVKLTYAKIISTVGILLALWQSHSANETFRSSIKPIIQIAAHVGEDLSYIKLQNNGLGPALLYNVRILRGGHPINPQEIYDLIGCGSLYPNAGLFFYQSKMSIKTSGSMEVLHFDGKMGDRPYNCKSDTTQKIADIFSDMRVLFELCDSYGRGTFERCRSEEHSIFFN